MLRKLAAVTLLITIVALPIRAEETAQSALERRFTDVVRPFLRNYCVGCHGTEKQEAKLNLSGYTTPSAVARN